MARAKLRVRAVLFCALSALAVPACQQYEGDGTSREDRMAVVRSVPDVCKV